MEKNCMLVILMMSMIESNETFKGRQGVKK
jgi:hypothetical protein